MIFKPAALILPLISSSKWRAVASGLIIEKVRSITKDTTKAALFSYDVISSRRGRVEGMEIIEGTGIQKVNAIVPLAEMFGYATDIRSKTQGRGTFSMEFKCYEQVPSNIETEIISKSGMANKE